ncbi:hypothetical protein WME98_10510 [Sorangium sp. So ce296]
MPYRGISSLDRGDLRRWLAEMQVVRRRASGATSLKSSGAA